MDLRVNEMSRGLEERKRLSAEELAERLRHELRRRYAQEKEKEAMLEERTSTIKEKDSVIQAVRAALVCPVCLEVPRVAPVAACRNGHTMCQACFTSPCPVCR